METRTKKVKVEPDEGQEHTASNIDHIKIKTEDGETIFIKKEKDVDEDENSMDMKETNTSSTVSIKQEKKSENTLLRTVLCSNDAKPVRRGQNYLKLIKKAPSNRVRGGAAHGNYKEKHLESKTEKKMPVVDVGTTRGVKRKNEDIEAKKSVIVLPGDGTKDISADAHLKRVVEKSKNIKIVFDVSGKLKEWRIEPESSKIPASNLGKILMYANMMKNSEEEREVEPEKLPPNLALIKSQIDTRTKNTKIVTRKSSKEDVDVEEGVVDADFRGFKCKICGKEFLYKQALTAHQKIHHLSLSGLPGSCPNYSDPKALKIKPGKSDSESADIRAASSKSVPSRTETAAKSKSPSATASRPVAASACKPPPATISKPAATTMAEHSVSKVTKTKPSSSLSKNSNQETATLNNPRPVTLVSANEITKFGPAFKADASTTTSNGSTYSPVSTQMFQCELCPKRFTSHELVQQHTKTHQRDKPFMCGLCDNRYFLHTDLEAHLLTHTDPNEQTSVLFTCSHCEEEFETEKQLQEHLKIHNNMETETVYECGMCGIELSSHTDLQIHMKRHIKNPFEPCKCGVCRMSFDRVAQLKIHIVREHFTQAEHVCKYCKCRFMNEDCLKRHMPVHEKMADSKTMKFAHRWKCRYCCQRYEYKPDMITHMRLEHPQSRFYDCSFCETSFITKEDLQAHIKTHSVVAHFL